MNNDRTAVAAKEPMFNIKEKAPIVLGVLLILIHVAIYYGGKIGLGFIEQWAGYWALLKSPDLMTGSELPMFTALLGHGFLHGSWTHVLLNVGMMVPFGVVTIRAAKLLATSKGRAPRGNGVFFLIFFAGVIVGGLGQLLYWIVTKDSGMALGASGGVSALFASAAWAMGGKKQLIKFGFGWLIINVLMFFFGHLLTGGGGVAWASHLAGFVAGGVLAPFFLRPSSANMKLVG